MIESLYNQQIEALRQRQRILVGMYRADIKDGDRGEWPALWYELLLEANKDMLRAKAAVRDWWQQSGMILR